MKVPSIQITLFIAAWAILLSFGPIQAGASPVCTDPILQSSSSGANPGGSAEARPMCWDGKKEKKTYDFDFDSDDFEEEESYSCDFCLLGENITIETAADECVRRAAQNKLRFDDKKGKAFCPKQCKNGEEELFRCPLMVTEDYDRSQGFDPRFGDWEDCCSEQAWIDPETGEEVNATCCTCELTHIGESTGEKYCGHCEQKDSEYEDGSPPWK